MHINVEIAKDHDKWNEYPEINEDFIASYARNIISRYRNFAAVQEIEISILLTGSVRIQELNYQFRGKNSATNVLSFPDHEIDFRHLLEFEVDLDYTYIGDIAFCYEVIKEESIASNLSFLDHFRHLLVHSILHLLGYDHMEEDEAEVMQNLEIEILREFGVKSPY